MANFHYFVFLHKITDAINMNDQLNKILEILCD